MSEKVNLIDFSDIFKTVGVDSDQESYVETHERTNTHNFGDLYINLKFKNCNFKNKF